MGKDDEPSQRDDEEAEWRFPEPGEEGELDQIETATEMMLDLEALSQNASDELRSVLYHQ